MQRRPNVEDIVQMFCGCWNMTDLPVLTIAHTAGNASHLWDIKPFCMIVRHYLRYKQTPISKLIHYLADIDCYDLHTSKQSHSSQDDCETVMPEIGGDCLVDPLNTQEMLWKASWYTSLCLPTHPKDHRSVKT